MSTAKLILTPDGRRVPCARLVTYGPADDGRHVIGILDCPAEDGYQALRPGSGSPGDRIAWVEGTRLVLLAGPLDDAEQVRRILAIIDAFYTGPAEAGAIGVTTRDVLDMDTVLQLVRGGEVYVSVDAPGVPLPLSLTAALRT